MIGDELALTKTLIDVFAMGDAYDEANFMRPLADIMSGLDATEADLFGRSYGQAMGVLSVDGARWRQATDLAVRLDLYEVVDSLLTQLASNQDPHQLANLVVLAQNPAVSAGTYERVIRAAGEAHLPSALKRYNEIRVSPRAKPQTDLEAALDAQVWPGKVSETALGSVAPLVYIAELDAPMDKVLNIASQLAAVGARVRRIPAFWDHDVPAEWLSSMYPVIAWSGLAKAQLRQRFSHFEARIIPAPADWASQLTIPRLLVNIQQAMPREVNLRLAPIWEVTETPAFSSATLSLGAFDSYEMAYLGAASRSVLSRISKDALRPIEADVHRWAFDQLVALRIFQAFKIRTGKPFRGDAALILRSLNEIAHASETERVGLDSNGEIVRERAGEYFNMRTGQEVFEQILLMDDAFKPISLGGTTVPDLLRPERTVIVHPATLAGTPTVIGRRISVRAIAQMAAIAPDLVVPSAYPELSGAEISDALRVGRRINLMD